MVWPSRSQKRMRLNSKEAEFMTTAIPTFDFSDGDATMKYNITILCDDSPQSKSLINMTTEMCVSNGHCFPPRRVA